ncbi:MAG: MBL fold metallo-hydrolase, partial [Clostridia bacterium]
MKKSIIKRSIGIIISLTVILSVLYFSKDIIQNAFKSSENIQETSSQIANDSSNLFEVHMINIGIGDSILIKSNDKAMLIDGGENDVGDKVLSYIKSQNVKKLDYIVASHPHSDHMGGLDYVVNNFDCENIILSTVKESATPTTKTYKDFLFAIKSKKLNVIKAITGKTFNLGDSTIEILGPVKEYEDLNDSSVVLKVTFGNTKFLFTGDIEKTAEQDLIDSGV